MSDIIPVFLGADLNCYNFARAFHEAYGVESYAYGRYPMAPTKYSKIIHFTTVPDMDNEDTMLRILHELSLIHILLTGSADKILRGTVDFQRGAKRGVGHESEDVLLFSPSARNRTAPLILCGEEEVEGQHAASVGRLDENKLYYLRSRGLSEACLLYTSCHRLIPACSRESLLWTGSTSFWTVKMKLPKRRTQKQTIG